jgi:hypothetical protein
LPIQKTRLMLCFGVRWCAVEGTAVPLHSNIYSEV